MRGNVCTVLLCENVIDLDLKNNIQEGFVFTNIQEVGLCQLLKC